MTDAYDAHDKIMEAGGLLDDATPDAADANERRLHVTGDWSELEPEVNSAALLLLDLVTKKRVYQGVAVTVQEQPAKDGVDQVSVDVTLLARPGPEQIVITIVQPNRPPENREFVVTRYGGHRHYSSANVRNTAIRLRGGVDGRWRTLCRGTSAWTLESWAKIPDHPQGLTAEQMEQLPVCPDCIEAMRSI